MRTDSDPPGMPRRQTFAEPMTTHPRPHDEASDEELELRLPPAEEPFAGDSDAESATEIPSAELPSPFGGNGVPDQVDEFVQSGLAALAEQREELRREHAALGGGGSIASGAAVSPTADSEQPVQRIHAQPDAEAPPG
jgi:hypothetical protein